MQKAYILNNPHGKTEGRFFWQESFESEEKKGICFIQESLINNEGNLNESLYLNNGWARLNCGTQPEGYGSHMFPNMKNPVLEENSKQKERINNFLKQWN